MRRRVRRAVLRCDAGAKVGAGHMVRSLALAEGFRRVGVEPFLLTPRLPDAWREMIRSRGIVLREAELPDGDPGLRELAELLGGDEGLVVLDSYAIGAEAVAYAWAAAGFVAVIRDGEPALGADAVIDHSLSADPARYRETPLALLGPRYALVREEFRDLSRTERGDGSPRVLVSLGGSAAGEVLPRVLEGLSRVPERINLRVVGAPWDCGPPVAGAGPHEVEWLEFQPTLAEELGSADLALLAAGGVRFEAAAAGCPMVLGILAENQVADAEAFTSAGLASFVGWWRRAEPEDVGETVQRALDSHELRETMVAKGRERVDGKGAERAAQKLKDAAESRVSR